VAALEPDTQLRRSFIYRKLEEQGAHFEAINGGAVAVSYGDDPEDEALLARRLGIADLSPLPRTGFKGAGTIEWLQSQDVTIGADSNRGYRQAGGEVALRLSPSEILLIDSIEGSGRFIAKLNAAWSWGTENPRKPIGYPLPRSDSHAWFALSEIRRRPDRTDVRRQDERHHPAPGFRQRAGLSSVGRQRFRRLPVGLPPGCDERVRRRSYRAYRAQRTRLMARGSPSKASDMQDPHGLAGKRDGNLETAIGREVRTFRRQLDMTVAELARQAGLSAGMLSKIENGMTSPSLDTLQSLSSALHVPVTAFFRKYEEERDATFVKAGEGLKIERRGTRAGHQYQLLGHSLRRPLAVEPYLITLTEDSDVFPLFQHEGIEFLYMLEGEVGYRHGNRTYLLTPGDSLFFDADVPHGPEELRKLPIRFISVITYLRESSE
jgi:transcriptional regulator with XRE-family HTH domain